MSDLSAAAAALGVPEPIVQRSAAARAAATGTSVEEVLAAWAGGAPPAAPPAEEKPAGPAAAETAAEEGVEEPEEPAPAKPETRPAATAVPPSAPPRAAPTPARPPVLVGETDNPMLVVLGALGLFLAVFFVGLVGPSIPGDNPGALSSELPFSAEAARGRAIYQSVGCAACHTQMVRPVVADVGLGAVTLDDSNQVLGTRRFGPDLSNVGARLDESQLAAVVGGLAGHPAATLSTDDLGALVAYLAESRTLDQAPAGGGGS